MQQTQLKIKKHLPRGLMFGSLAAILFIVLLIPFITWLLEYKDTITAPLTITTKTTPVDIFAKSAGELKLLVSNQTPIDSNTTLAYIENTADFEAINILKSKLNQPTKSVLNIAKDLCESKRLKVGELQPALVQLIKEFETYQTFLKTDRHTELAQSRQDQIALFEHKRILYQERSSLIDDDQAYVEGFIKTDKQLRDSSVIAQRQFDESERTIISNKIAEVNNKTQINDLDIAIKILAQEELEINSAYQAKDALLINNIKDAFQLLENQLGTWELTYLLKSNIAGTCVYKDYLNDYRYVEKEEKIFSIIPSKDSLYFGLLKLPIAGAGKVELGDPVQVKLHNYPFMEFGIVTGQILSISDLPFNNEYNVQVVFPEGFKTSYDTTLTPSQLMYGIGDIVVDQKSLYDRIANQVKSMWLNR